MAASPRRTLSSPSTAATTRLTSPTIAQQGLTEQTDTAPLTTTIPVTFTDLDLSDVGHSATITDAVASGATTGLALDEAALIALVTPGLVTKAAGSIVRLGRSVVLGGLDRVRLSGAGRGPDADLHGCDRRWRWRRDAARPSSSPLPAPTTRRRSWVKSIPPRRPLFVAAPTAPIVLAPGVNVNSLGLNTETFDGVAAGSASNNGAGSGNFESAALGATFLGIRK